MPSFAVTSAEAVRPRSCISALTGERAPALRACPGHARKSGSDHRRPLRHPRGDRTEPARRHCPVGAVEDACRHLTADGLDATAARRGLAGVETVLPLRTVMANGGFEDY